MSAAGREAPLEFEAVVYVDGPNRNFFRFRPEALPAFAASFVGAPFLRDHDVGRIASRDGVVVASRYTGGAIRQRIRLTTRRGREDYRQGRIDRFSIGWFWRSVTCSVCGGDWLACPHTPGRIYQGTLCELIFEEPQGKETSAVNAPAVPGTGLLAALCEQKRLKHRDNRVLPQRPQSSQREERGEGRERGSEGECVIGERSSEFYVNESGSELTGKQNEQERNEMMDAELNGQTVAGAGEGWASLKAEGSAPVAAPVAGLPASAPQGGEGAAGRAEEAPVRPGEIEALIAALRQEVAAARLRSSGLSAEGQAAVRVALAAAGPGSAPEQVDALIEAQRSVEARARRPYVVQGVRAGVSAVQSAEERMQAHLNWMFGDPAAPLPPPNLRSIRDLYLAITGDYDFHGRCEPLNAQLAAATTATLPGMAVSALNKVMLTHYGDLALYRWYERIVSVAPHDGSAAELQLVMLNGVSDLPIVAEGAAYPEGAVGDSRETAVFSKHGKYVGVTLEMFRRNDVASLQLIPRALVTAAVRTRSAAIAALFTANGGVGPVLAADGKTLFHADHGNLASTRFSAAAWAEARAECFAHAEPGSGKRLGFWPAYCLTPIDLYDAALEVFGYGSGEAGRATQSGQEVNPYGAARPGDPRPTPIVVPDWTDAAGWAYIVDPRLSPVIQMAYAGQPQGGGHPAPEIFSVSSETQGLMFTHDVLPVKVRDWWTVGVATPAGIGKRNIS